MHLGQFFLLVASLKGIWDSAPTSLAVCTYSTNYAFTVNEYKTNQDCLTCGKEIYKICD